MKSFRFILFVVVPLLLHAPATHSQSVDTGLLDRQFDLAAPHVHEAQYFVMESRLTTLALDGTRLGTDVYKLLLMFDPKINKHGTGDGYRCVRFTISPGDSVILQIPVLKNWTYVLPESGYDNQGHVLGIDHGHFENIQDDKGQALPFDKAYHIYNAFIDFHAFCTIFADPTTDGHGIQDLNVIGDKVVHAAAFSQPPTNLGSHIAEGSFFRNGEIILAFKGLTVENGHPCALIGYDSGSSAFKMIMHPMPDLEIIAVGSSHYWGDIAKSLNNQWMQKATMVELVIAESALPMPPGKINSVVERTISIHNVSKDAFYQF
ncbi:hypothetical protein KAR48_14900 [bacterium]|nr:hypothetical protein [bacterium]